MSRNSRKGASFEQQVADYIRKMTGNEFVERRVKNGAKDRGDIAGVLMHGKRTVVECKNHRRYELAEWIKEAEVERGNDDAEYAFVVVKRPGCGEKSFGDNLVVCTLENFCAMQVGGRDLLELSQLEQLHAMREKVRDRVDFYG